MTDEEIKQILEQLKAIGVQNEEILLRLASLLAEQSDYDESRKIGEKTFASELDARRRERKTQPRK